jgi:hypothetical protein
MERKVGRSIDQRPRQRDRHVVAARRAGLEMGGEEPHRGLCRDAVTITGSWPPLFL